LFGSGNSTASNEWNCGRRLYQLFSRSRKCRARSRLRGFPTDAGKVIVEHTNINPNKAAHIGHLRNAAIGDTFVRVLRAGGRTVEVQNYIDNTGVQVADVIVGLKHVEHKSLDEVRRMVTKQSPKFDYYCWDVYARVSGFYEAEDPKHVLRGQTLKKSKKETTKLQRWRKSSQ
jgi:arginyl-tRNA synthetase